MKMRMWYIALLSLLALTACQQEPVLSEGGDGNSFDPSKLSYNITIDHPDGATTKGVKKEWENGDKVFLFIQGQGITTGYLTATLKETAWETAYVGTEAASLEPTGILHAVYLPYGNDATPSYDGGQWTFSSGTDTYYFIAQNINYKVSSGVLSATVQMVNPGEFVQFFIRCENASGTIQLACNGLRPAGFAGIDPDTGTVTENLGDAGTAVPGYPDTLEGEEGYYVSGKPTPVNNNDYYFALQKADGSYAHYFKNRSAIVNNKAYKLPAYSSWRGVGGNLCVQIAGKRWKTVNKGATHPWEMGTPTPSFNPDEGKGLPTADNWSALLDPNVADWKGMDIMGQKGYLVVSKDAPTNYIFLPWSTDSDTDYWIDEFDSVVRIAADGTKSNGVTPAPGTAYARMIETANYFRIKATVDGTTMTFQYTDGTIQFSENQGESWDTYSGKTFNLNAGEEVWFKGNRTDCNLTGNKQLFNANHVCYIAGDITTLLADPTTLPANAFRSAFSYGALKDSETEKENSLPVASGTVYWVDINSKDPLILPASTAANCYLEMFMGCTSLHFAPDLPATVLQDKCYFRMFYGCTGLESIPSYPPVVTMSGTSTERRYCFQMFQNCTGIEELTEPLFVGQNSTLARGCFEDMFAHCTSLTKVISGLLPATTLATNCYRGMFQDTAITRAPDLLAEELVSNCYRFMFNACKSVEYIKCYSTTDVKNDSYTRNWLQNAKTTGEFHYRSGTTWYRNNLHGIPSGWTPRADDVQ